LINEDRKLPPEAHINHSKTYQIYKFIMIWTHVIVKFLRCFKIYILYICDRYPSYVQKKVSVYHYQFSQYVFIYSY